MSGGWDSIMCIASRYGLDGPESNPGGNEIFRAVQTDLKVHPMSYTMVTECFPGAKRLERGDDHPPPSSAGMRMCSSYISAILWGDLNLLNKYKFFKENPCFFLKIGMSIREARKSPRTRL